MSKTLGQINYEAYCATTNWKSLASGADLPQWTDTNPDIQEAWESAAAAVFTEIFEKLPPIDHASVKVMRSHDYCHFGVQLGTDINSRLTLQQVDDLRKAAARLADKAVDQYRMMKTNAYNLAYSELQTNAAAVRNIPEDDRTPEQKAVLKAYQDRVYDYQDDWREN